MSKKPKILKALLTSLAAASFIAAIAGVAFCSYAAILFVPAVAIAIYQIINTAKVKLANKNYH